MANTCAHCGATTEGGSFCSSCGQALDVQAPPTGPSGPPDPESTTIRPPAEDVTQVPMPAPQTTQQLPSQQLPAQPPPYAAPPPQGFQAGYQQGPPPGQSQGPPPGQGYQQPGYPPQGYPQQGYPPQGYAQQHAPKVNPFVGWPLGDYVRDAAAAFFLFAALGMPWEIGFSDDRGGNQWWVVIAVLLSVLSLVVPYLAKARVVGGWSPQHYRLVKLGLNVPLVGSALAQVIVELVNVGDEGAGGIGSGIAMALAGVALAVQQRQADEEPSRSDDRLWVRLANGAAIGAVALSVLSYVAFLVDGLVDDTGLFDEPVAFVALTVGFLGMSLAVVAWPAVQMLGGHPAWRRVFATSGFTVLVIALFSLADDGQALFFWFPVEKWNTPVGGTFVLGLATGLAVSRAKLRQGEGRIDPVTGWMRTVSAALMVSAAGSAILAVTIVLSMVAAEEFEAAPIVVTIMVLAMAGAAGFATTLVGNPQRQRPLLLGLLGVVVLVGCISMGIVNGQDIGIPIGGSGFGVLPIVTGWVVAAWLSLPVLAAYGLTVPGDVRRALGPLVPASTGQGGYPQQGYQQGYQQGPPPGYQQGPPPGYQHPPQGYPPPQQQPPGGQPGAWGPPGP